MVLERRRRGREKEQIKDGRTNRPGLKSFVPGVAQIKKESTFLLPSMLILPSVTDGGVGDTRKRALVSLAEIFRRIPPRDEK